MQGRRIVRSGYKVSSYGLDRQGCCRAGSSRFPTSSTPGTPGSGESNVRPSP
ncbi:hypothetical protein HMPREF9057_02490 [Actinomyces sp. oral taxon 171 str. F0337]|nr:hypothetical protein HMPREF9057_02490 [Actinomyces sp. oral taxon 171 str. F0337]